MCAARASPLLVLAALLLLAVGPANAAAAEAGDAPICQQGLLKLEEPRGPPERVAGGLPFCDQFSCSCCNRSHALGLARGYARATVDAEEDGVSAACARALRLLACRPCDPEVGTGLKPGVCRATCDQAFEACREDYFSFSEASGTIVPCSSALVCSLLKEHATNGAEYCEAAGLPVSDGAPCYDGKASRDADKHLCAASDAAQRARQEQRQQRRRRRGGGGGPVAAVVAWLQEPRGWGRVVVLVGALLFGAAALRTRQQQRRGLPRRMPLPPQLQRRQAPGGGGGGGGNLGGGGGGDGLLSAEERRQVLLQAARVREAAARARTAAPNP